MRIRRALEGGDSGTVYMTEAQAMQNRKHGSCGIINTPVFDVEGNAGQNIRAAA